MTGPENLPDDPRDLLGASLWDRLGQSPPPDLPAGFDARFQAALGVQRPWYRQHARALGASAVGLAALAAAAAVMLRSQPPVAPATPADDLTLVADLALVENLDLLEDLDVLLVWDGTAP
jgi:hypothetical protein